MNAKPDHSNASVLKIIGRTIKRITRACWKVLVVCANLIQSFFVALEKALKIVVLFIVALSASVLFLVTSLYLLSAAFGLKESPSFQSLRDRVTRIYSLSLEDELRETEARVQVDIVNSRRAHSPVK